MMNDSSKIQTMKFSSRIYQREAILMTAGEYGPAYSFGLDMDNDYFVVDVHYDASSGPIDEIQFEQKLIENSIRQDILAKTGQTRMLLMARAFASTIIDLSTEQGKSEYGSMKEDESIFEDYFNQTPGHTY